MFQTYLIITITYNQVYDSSDSAPYLPWVMGSKVHGAPLQYIPLLGIPTFSLFPASALVEIIVLNPQDYLSNLQLWLCWDFPKLIILSYICFLLILFEYMLQVISQWLMDQPPLGHKAPRPGMGRLVVCPACPAFFQAPSSMSSRHTYD